MKMMMMWHRMAASVVAVVAVAFTTSTPVLAFLCGSRSRQGWTRWNHSKRTIGDFVSILAFHDAIAQKTALTSSRLLSLSLYATRRNDAPRRNDAATSTTTKTTTRTTTTTTSNVVVVSDDADEDNDSPAILLQAPNQKLSNEQDAEEALQLFASPTPVSIMVTAAASSASAAVVEDNQKNNNKNNNSHQNDHHHLQSSWSSLSSTTNTTLYLGPWMERVLELQRFVQRHGHARVPKRYQDNPALGNWVNKQRVEYRKYLSNRGGASSSSSSSTLTAERIALLNQLGFCWNATMTTTMTTTTTTSSSSLLLMNHQDSPSSLMSRRRKMAEEWKQAVAAASTTTTTRTRPTAPATLAIPEQEWWRQYQELCQYMQEQGLTCVHHLPLKSKWDDWVRRTRQSYYWQRQERQQEQQQEQQQTQTHDVVAKSTLSSSSSSSSLTTHPNRQRLLSKQQIQAMTALDPQWRLASRRQARWERRFAELVQYRRRYGHVCVPISYAANPKLAHWVSTQRKQYNLYGKRKQQQQQQDKSLHSNDTTTFTLQQQEQQQEQERRWQRLESIGFVWNRWEHEFALKQVESTTRNPSSSSRPFF